MTYLNNRDLCTNLLKSLRALGIDLVRYLGEVRWKATCFVGRATRRVKREAEGAFYHSPTLNCLEQIPFSLFDFPSVSKKFHSMHCILHCYQISMRYLYNIENYPMASSSQAEEAAFVPKVQQKAHQIAFADEKQQDGLDLYPNREGVGGKGKGMVNWSQKKNNLSQRVESYKGESEIPPGVKDLAVTVDADAWTVILPIMGRPVPFHLSTVRNANTTKDFSRADGREFVYLRINFCFPGRTGQSQKYSANSFEEPNGNFVTSVTLRSGEKDRMEFLAWQITELRKDYIQKEQEKRILVDARKLIEVASMFD